ncbi:MAG: glycosyltransferase family 1 protein [Deltaproteobacteria bacterium]|nr:glycosyltransferase family 1 protein [Deltaproteobacteria bacterium]
MSRLLAWVGNSYFSSAMSDHGWEVRHIDLSKPWMDWAGIVRRIGSIPDLIVYGDRSLIPPILGLESFPCPTLFYCVDSHIHTWYPFYAQAFDLVAMNLWDHLPAFLNLRLHRDRFLWLPLYSKAGDLPHITESEFDLLFVGKVDPELTPGRAAFLTELNELFPKLVLRRGDYRSLYPKARIVLNVAEHGDMNFRVFEAMGCGSCLLTPDIGHGQDRLFVHGRDFWLYHHGDAKSAAKAAERLLFDDELRLTIGRNAWKKITEAHKPIHRAATLAAWLDSFDLQELMHERLKDAARIRETYLKVPYLHFAEQRFTEDLRQAYLRHATPQTDRSANPRTKE